MYEYIEDLYHSLEKPGIDERKNVGRMKKFLNFVGLSVDAEGKFFIKCEEPKPRKNYSAL